MSGQTDGWLVDSSESPTVAFRPQLLVTYQMVPEPGSLELAVFAGLGLVVTGWRRRYC